MNNRKAKKLMQHGTLFTVEGTSVVGMSMGYKGKGEIDSFNLIDVVKGIAVKRCDGKCRLATKKERMMYWVALTHIVQKGDNHKVKVMNSEYFRIASDKEIFKAKLDRLKEETYIGLSERDNGVEQGRMEVINALYRLLDSMQEEPKKCIYTKDNYTDEDRKVLCNGCEEECKYARKEEPVSEDLEKEMQHYFCKEWAGDPVAAARHFAEWQKQQMMKAATDGQMENGEDYLRIKCLSASCRPQDDGKMVKLIIIKED